MAGFKKVWHFRHNVEKFVSFCFVFIILQCVFVGVSNSPAKQDDLYEKSVQSTAQQSVTSKYGLIKVIFFHKFFKRFFLMIRILKMYS